MSEHQRLPDTLHRRVDVSVLIATRDRADSLERTLTCLVEQEAGDFSWEVIVVDNGSTDRTPRVLDDFADRVPLLHLEHAEAGKNRALNRAIARARGDLLVFTDDDVVPAPDWLKALTDATARWPKENIFGGPIVPRFPAGAADWMRDPSFRHTRWAFGGYHPRSKEGPTWQTPLGANMAIRRVALPESGYDESIGPAGSNFVMGSEVELLLRMYRDGEQFIFVPDAPVEHVLDAHHVTVETLLVRARRFGRSEARLFPAAPNYPVLAVSPYRWSRLLAVTLRWFRSRVGGEGRRRVADFEVAAAWATVREQFAMWREWRQSGEGLPRRLFPRPGAVLAQLRRRGPVKLAIRASRMLISPLVRGHTVLVYEAPLGNAPFDGDETGLDIVVCHGIGESHTARSLICPMEIMTPEEVDARLGSGHSVAIARQGGTTVGYAWASFTDHHVAELDRTLRISNTEVCAYDGFVRSGSRGRGILPALDRAQMRFARELGRDRQLTYALRQNRSSNRSMVRMGKVPLLTVRSIEVPLLGRRFVLSSDRQGYDALFES